MKSLFLTAIALIFTAAVVSSPSASAADKGPCGEILVACEKAGFKRGGHNEKTNEYKGLYRDCIQKIMDGETVAGVTIPAAKVAACKDKKAKRKMSRPPSR